jgi:hypothetical protein
MRPLRSLGVLPGVVRQPFVGRCRSVHSSVKGIPFRLGVLHAASVPRAADIVRNLGYRRRCFGGTATSEEPTTLNIVDFHEIVDGTLEEILDRIDERGLDDKLEAEVAVSSDHYIRFTCHC